MDDAGKKLAGLEGGDHEFQQAEKEFFRSLAVILAHLQNRALKAEARVYELQRELDARRDQVEYMGDKIASQ